jgi:hypothetical protein
MASDSNHNNTNQCMNETSMSKPVYKCITQDNKVASNTLPSSSSTKSLFPAVPHNSLNSLLDFFAVLSRYDISLAAWLFAVDFLVNSNLIQSTLEHYYLGEVLNSFQQEVNHSIPPNQLVKLRVSVKDSVQQYHFTKHQQEQKFDRETDENILRVITIFQHYLPRIVKANKQRKRAKLLLASGIISFACMLAYSASKFFSQRSTASADITATTPLGSIINMKLIFQK